MSTFARLTLVGLYNHAPEIFDKLTLPDAYNVDTFIETLLLDQGEKCVAYTEPDFFKFAVGVWSRKWADSLKRIALALTEEYNPLHNYDRHEEWTEKESGDYANHVDRGGEDKTSYTGSDETKNTGTVTTSETGTKTETTNNMVTERTVSAFNENGYQPDEKNTVSGSVTTTPNTTQTVTPNTTETVTRGTAETTEYGGTEDGRGEERRDREHIAHLYGNIGVTTSQKMSLDEIELRKEYNMYSIAATLFADDMLLMIY